MKPPEHGGEDLKEKLGPLGEFPRGKIHPADNGALKFAVMAKDGNVVMAFGTEISWVGFSPEQAESIADALRLAAAQARKWAAS